MSMYPEHLVAPMRSELTDGGLVDLKSAEEVDNVMKQKGTVLMVVNSVCGCAAGAARPGVLHALNTGKKPEHTYTVFAGVATEATKRAREYMLPYPPSSPCVALFKDGNLVHMIERHHIEGRPAALISANLKAAFEEYC